MAETNTREKILETSGKLFAQRGYFGISMQEIADEVGITKAALYYHFEGKEELVKTLMNNTVQELKNQLKKTVEDSKIPSDILFNLIKAFLDFKIKNPELSLLTSLGSVTDERIPTLQFLVDLRTELIKFIRELIAGIDFARRMTYRTIFTLTTSVISFVLSPLNYDSRSAKQLARDFTVLFFSENINSSSKKATRSVSGSK